MRVFFDATCTNSWARLTKKLSRLARVTYAHATTCSFVKELELSGDVREYSSVGFRDSGLVAELRVATV
jgi:hypothetical protein